MVYITYQCSLVIVSVWHSTYSCVSNLNGFNSHAKKQISTALGSQIKETSTNKSPNTCKQDKFVNFEAGKNFHSRKINSICSLQPIPSIPYNGKTKIIKWLQNKDLGKWTLYPGK